MKLKAIDIAEKLGISKTTVSLALNNRPGISEETRKRVIACREEMLATGYTVHEHRVIKLLIFCLPQQVLMTEESSFYNRMIDGMKEALNEQKYDLEILHLPDNVAGIKEGAKVCNKEKVAGVIALTSTFTANMEERDIMALHEFEMPVVLYDSDVHTIKYDQVRADNHEAVQIALRYLKYAGHQHIVFVTTGKGEYYNLRKRRKSAQEFSEKYRSKGIRVEILYLGEDFLEGVEKELMEYFRLEKNIPTAFVTDNCETTVVLLRQLEKKGLDIPGECSVIGIDPLREPGSYKKKLTYIDLMDERRGLFAMKRLLERIDGKAREVIRVEVSPVLVEGETVEKILGL